MAFRLDTGPDDVITIKTIGVDGGGSNIVNRMVKSGVKGMNFIVISTDKWVLAISSMTFRIQIGKELIGGQDAGNDPEVGRKSTEENRSVIFKTLEGTGMVFITVDMGDGTGTGAAPIVADITKEMDILTVNVVAKPFSFRGHHRMIQAEKDVEELRTRVDSLVIIPNERLKLITSQRTAFANAFKIADDVLRQATQSTSDLIKNTSFISPDFANVTAVMQNAGIAHMGIDRTGNKNKAEGAAKVTISSPPLETSISGAEDVLVNITGSMDIGLEEVGITVNPVQRATRSDVLIIFDAAFGNTLEDEIRITVIATGLEEVEGAMLSKSSNIVAERKAETQPRAPVTPAAPAEEDPFGDIFKIFSWSK